MALPSALIFDFDGTLVTGTNGGYVRCYHAAALTLGYELPFEVTEARVQEKWGAAPRIELQSVLRHALHLVEGALIEYEKLLNTDFFSNAVAPVGGANAALNEIRQMSIKPVVISGMPQSLLEKFSREYDFQFEKHELISTIDTDDPLKQKSTGYHLKQMMESNGWHSGELFVIGDAHSDIAMAQTQSIRTIAVLTGFLTEKAARDLGAYKILQSVAELPNHLRFEA